MACKPERPCPCFGSKRRKQRPTKPKIGGFLLILSRESIYYSCWFQYRYWEWHRYYQNFSQAEYSAEDAEIGSSLSGYWPTRAPPWGREEGCPKAPIKENWLQGHQPIRGESPFTSKPAMWRFKARSNCRLHVSSINQSINQYRAIDWINPTIWPLQ